MFKIGDVDVKSTAILAPMAGITSSSYRDFMRNFGVNLTYTEMVSDCGLIYENENTFDLLKSSASDHPLAVQLFGNSKETLTQAIKILEESNYQYEILDINLACPVPKVYKNGAGSALLKVLSVLEDVMKAVVEASSKPVTAKIRLGFYESTLNFHETIKVLEKVGVRAIALHLRSASQMYSGKARYELAKNLRDEMSVPLMISGDINSLEDAIKAKEITHADGIMVARGGVGNPFLITQIESYFNDGVKLEDMGAAERLDALLKYADMLIEEKGEYRAMRNLRGTAIKFVPKVPRQKYYRNLIAMNLNSKNDLINYVNLIKSENNL